MNHLGADTVISVSGQAYTLSRFTRRLLREFLAWVAARNGNPFDYLAPHFPELSPSVQAVALRHCEHIAKDRRSAYSSEALTLWTLPPGQVKILALLLRKYHPGFTAVEDLYIDGCQEHGDGYFVGAFIETIGRMPRDELEAERELFRAWGILPPLPVPKTTPVAEDWLAIDQLLIKHFNLRPWELNELTMSEIMVLFSSIAPKNERPLSEALDHVGMFGQLSPSQKFELFRQTS